MKSSITEIIPIIGTAMGGGFYAGRIRVGDAVFAIIVAPKESGEFKGKWSGSNKRVAGAESYFDGAENTKAMATADSAMAKWALDLRIGGNDDWYIPAQDELEIIYRNLKPTTEENYLYGRSGINVSAVTPTYPYTPKSPAQTLTEAFQTGGPEEFDPNWYWSSTQHAADADYAWIQDFNNGYQVNGNKSAEGRARAVRRLVL